jgi:trehalose 6-phosphate synthase/phosphatase
VVLISGRDHFLMEEWFGDLDINMVAEHGIWSKENGVWKQIRDLSSAWKTEVYPLIQKFIEKTPGSFIEEKPFSLAFHYRRSDSWLAEVRAPQLISALKPVCENNDLNILDGNKVVEVRIAGVDKGSAAYKWLSKGSWDFVIAIGDDKTDEDMFNVMPESAYTIKVGTQVSLAQWRIRNCEKVHELLQHLVTYTAMQEKQNGLYKKAV